jgi:hypothetical protein
MHVALPLRPGVGRDPYAVSPAFWRGSGYLTKKATPGVMDPGLRRDDLLKFTPMNVKAFIDLALSKADNSRDR